MINTIIYSVFIVGFCVVIILKSISLYVLRPFGSEEDTLVKMGDIRTFLRKEIGYSLIILILLATLTIK